MKKSDKKFYIFWGTILILGLPTIISGSFSNCVLKFNFTGKCFTEQFSSGITVGLNKYTEKEEKVLNNKINKLQESLNKINTGSLIIK